MALVPECHISVWLHIVVSYNLLKNLPFVMFYGEHQKNRLVYNATKCRRQSNDILNSLHCIWTFDCVHSKHWQTMIDICLVLFLHLSVAWRSYLCSLCFMYCYALIDFWLWSQCVYYVWLFWYNCFKMSLICSMYHFYYCVWASCELRGCKTRPAAFPGRMSYKATKPSPGSLCPVS